MPKGLALYKHMQLMIGAEPHQKCAERTTPFPRRAKIAHVSAAARAHHVGADASRKTQHKIVSGAPCRGRRCVCKSQQRHRASHPGASDAHDLPVVPPFAAAASDLVRENCNLMPRPPPTLRSHDHT